MKNTVLIQTPSCLYSNESSECAESKSDNFNHKRIWISQDMDNKSKIIDIQNSSNTYNSAQWNKKTHVVAPHFEALNAGNPNMVILIVAGIQKTELFKV